MHPRYWMFQGRLETGVVRRWAFARQYPFTREAAAAETQAYQPAAKRAGRSHGVFFWLVGTGWSIPLSRTFVKPSLRVHDS